RRCSLGAAFLLRLHGPTVRLDARSGDVGQCAEQTCSWTHLRVPRGMGGGPVWAPPHDDVRHPDGRDSLGGTGLDLEPRHVLLSRDRRVTLRDAAVFLPVVLALLIAGGLLRGWLADRLTTTSVVLLPYLLVAAGIPLRFHGPSQPILSVSAAKFGIGLGGDNM